MSDPDRPVRLPSRQGLVCSCSPSRPPAEAPQALPLPRPPPRGPLHCFPSPPAQDSWLALPGHLQRCESPSPPLVLRVGGPSTFTESNTPHLPSPPFCFSSSPASRGLMIAKPPGDLVLFFPSFSSSESHHFPSPPTLTLCFFFISFRIRQSVSGSDSLASHSQLERCRPPFSGIRRAIKRPVLPFRIQCRLAAHSSSEIRLFFSYILSDLFHLA